jgi:integrase
MSDKNSSKARSPKPPRPPDAVLFWHPSGRWCKKIKGKQYYFGRDDYASALAKYEQKKDDLFVGRVPDEPGSLTVGSLCKQFLTTKLALLDAGELSRHTVDWYGKVCKLLCERFGKARPVSDLEVGDFEKLKTWMTKRANGKRRWAPVRVANFVNGVRVVFNYAYENKLIDKPMVYGQGFKRPSKKVIRRHRREQGLKMFEAHELKAMIDKAGPALRAMLYLAINGGLGNTDVSHLPLSALDLKSGWLDYPRPKTGVERKIPLWRETTESIRDWLRVRPEPVKDEHADLLFLTAKGGSWDNQDNPVTRQTTRLMAACGLNGHRNFYSVRHTFQPIADESGDFIAVRKIMGHTSSDIADHYRERISDTRLSQVVEHVRAWLFDQPENEGRQPQVLPMTKSG